MFPLYFLVGIPLGGDTTGGGNGGDDSRKPHSLAGLGFIVTDAALRPVSANREAIAILNYPEKNGNAREAFEKKLRSHLLRNQGPLSPVPVAIQFKSGRRTYFCRSLLLDGTSTSPGSPAILIVLQRCLSESMALSQVSEQFRLTRREQEAVMLLLDGLSNKEMAERMSITANTVKALLRLVMVKMQVTSRAAVAAAVLGLMRSAMGREN